MKRVTWVLLGAAVLGACTDDQKPIQTAPLDCAAGGHFLVGPPQLIDGVCERIPAPRQLEVRPRPGDEAYQLLFAGAALDGQATARCEVLLAPNDALLDGVSAHFAGAFSVSGDRFEAVLEQTMTGLPPGELCDARYRLVGQKYDPATLGNPTGGVCGTGAQCANNLCAYGEVSACQFDACVFQRDPAGEEHVFCTEPCEPGSCPDGYECLDFGNWAFRADGHFFCGLTVPVCGDGVRERYEACDDGDTSGGDGCSADCLSDETCGNGLVDVARGESCDDGNFVGGDGCSALCRSEACGNLEIDLGETCDDGNGDPGDGCSADCQLELCGNAVLDPSEACDDGNLASTDGCDGLCRVTSAKGVAWLDSAFARTMVGAADAQIAGYAAVPLGPDTLAAWSESYPDGGPYGTAREVYTMLRSAGAAAFVAPVRHANLAGFTVESLARLDSGELVVALRSGTDFFLARSTDLGASFSDPAPMVLHGVPVYTEDGAFLRLHSDGLTLYATFGVNVLVVGQNRNLFFSRSIDGGTTWQNALRLSPQPDFRGFASVPRVLAFQSGEVLIAWGDGALGGGALYAARSLDSGATWIRISENMGQHATGRRDVTYVALENSGPYFYMAWAGPQGLKVARWSRNPSAWQVSTLVGGATLDSRLIPPALVRGSGSSLHLAFVSGGAVFVTRSLDLGQSFSAPYRVARLPDNVRPRSIAAVQLGADFSQGTPTTDRLGLVFVADLAAGGPAVQQVFGVKSEDGGASWSRDAASLGALGSISGNGGPFDRLPGSRQFALGLVGRQLLVADFFAVPAGVAEHDAPGDPGQGCPAALLAGGWCVPSGVGAPSARSRAPAVFTGSKVVWLGGNDGFRARADGGVYDVTQDTWSAVDFGAAPLVAWGRYDHTAVWTGTEVLVFGGTNGLVALGDGLGYSPNTNTWRRLASAGAPAPRYAHTAVWTGSEMLVFGGRDATGARNDGGRYDPGTDTWEAMPAGPLAVYGHSAVWSGTHMLVFGGAMNGGAFSSGGFAYDPLGSDASAYTAFPTVGAPTPRAEHATAWTGSQLLVLGGRDGAGALASGGKLGAGAWTALPVGPSGRYAAVSVLTPGAWVVWGGTNDTSGAVYDLALGSWTAMPTALAPAPRRYAAAVWALDRVVVLGGDSVDGKPLAGGGVFVP